MDPYNYKLGSLRLYIQIFIIIHLDCACKQTGKPVYQVPVNLGAWHNEKCDPIASNTSNVTLKKLSA